MTELERLLTAQFERMEQRHQDETKALQEQLDAQLRAGGLQAQLQSTLEGYETHCANLHTPPSWPWRKSTRSELASMGGVWTRPTGLPEQRLELLNSSVSTVKLRWRSEQGTR